MMGKAHIGDGGVESRFWACILGAKEAIHVGRLIGGNLSGIDRYVEISSKV